MRKPLPNALDIDFKGGLSSEVTPHAGIALFLETGRWSGVMAAATARQYLDRSHEAALLDERPAQGSFIPRQSDWRAGLRAVLRHSVRTFVSAVTPGPAVTLNVDAHLVESSKQEARWTYKGFPGYQPLLVSWAETGLVMGDEFRDGNVPAAVGIKELVDGPITEVHEPGARTSSAPRNATVSTSPSR